MLAAEQGFQNQEFYLQVLPSLLSPCCLFCSHPSFAMAKSSKPSFFDFSPPQNTTETLATSACCLRIILNPYPYGLLYFAKRNQTKPLRNETKRNRCETKPDFKRSSTLMI